MKLREYFPEFLIYILEETTMQKTFICACCNRKHPVSKRCTFDGHELCQNCYNTETCLCDRCKNRIWAKDSCGDENHSLCHNCEDHYYRRCTDCGQLVSLMICTSCLGTPQEYTVANAISIACTKAASEITANLILMEE